MMMMMPREQRMLPRPYPASYAPTDVAIPWKILFIVAACLATVITIVGLVISILRITSLHSHRAETGDWVLLAMSCLYFALELTAELMSLIPAFTDPDWLVANLKTLETLYLLSIIIDVVCIGVAVFVSVSTLKAEYEDFIKELVTVFLGYMGLNFFAIFVALLSMINISSKVGSMVYYTPVMMSPAVQQPKIMQMQTQPYPFNAQWQYAFSGPQQ